MTFADLQPPKQPGTVRYRVEIKPHDWANDGEAWETGTGSPAEVAHSLRGYADWVESAAKDEAAALQARRDELARELTQAVYGPDADYPSYEMASRATQVAIDRLAAAEAEVARLKGEGR